MSSNVISFVRLKYLQVIDTSITIAAVIIKKSFVFCVYASFVGRHAVEMAERKAQEPKSVLAAREVRGLADTVGMFVHFCLCLHVVQSSPGGATAIERWTPCSYKKNA